MNQKIDQPPPIEDLSPQLEVCCFPRELNLIKPFRVELAIKRAVQGVVQEEIEGGRPAVLKDAKPTHYRLDVFYNDFNNKDRWAIWIPKDGSQCTVELEKNGKVSSYEYDKSVFELVKTFRKSGERSLHNLNKQKKGKIIEFPKQE